MRTKAVLLLSILCSAFISAQDMPTSWTSHYRIRQYAAHANPGSDSLNANWSGIDAAIWNGTKGATTFNPSVTLGVANSATGQSIFYNAANAFAGTVQSAVLGAARTWTLPDATGTLATLNGGQTFTSATWQGTAVDTAYTNAQSRSANLYGLIIASSGKSYFFKVDTSLIVTQSGLNINFVPYTGATKAVNLGAQNFSTTGTITSGVINSNTNLSATASPTFGGLTLNGRLVFPLDVWNGGGEPTNRIYFSTSGTSYFRGYGNPVAVELRNGSDAWIARFNNDGTAELPSGLTLNGNLSMGSNSITAGAINGAGSQDLYLYGYGGNPTSNYIGYVAFVAKNRGVDNSGKVLISANHTYGGGPITAIFDDDQSLTLGSTAGTGTGSFYAGAATLSGIFTETNSTAGLVRQLIDASNASVVQSDIEMRNNGGSFYFGINKDAEGRAFWDNRLSGIRKYSWQFVGVEKLSVDASGNAITQGTITVNGTGTSSIAGPLSLTNSAFSSTTEAGGWQSASYASQTTGWRAGANGQADFRYLYTDELHAKSFISDIEQVSVGLHSVQKSASKIDSTNFTIPSAGASGTLIVEEIAGFTGQVFANSDTVMVRTMSRTAANAMDIAWALGKVTYLYRNASNNPPTQAYTFLRLSSAGGSATGTASKGTLVLDLGQGPGGYTQENAIDGLNGVNSPYYQVVTYPNVDSTKLTVQARLGNLSGIVDSDLGTLSGYGLYTQNGYFKGNIFVKSSTAQALQNNAIQIGNITGTANSAVKVTNTGTASTSGVYGYTSGGAESFALRLDGTAQVGGFAFTNTTLSSTGIGIVSGASSHIALGSTLPTAYNSGTGVWLGNDGTFLAGNAAGSRVQWDGTNITVVAANASITGTTGWLGSSANFSWTGTTVTAGGFTVGASTITATNFTLTSGVSASLALGSATAFGTGTGVWADNSAAGQFRVGDPAGNRISYSSGGVVTLVATNANISGTTGWLGSSSNFSWSGSTVTAGGFTVGASAVTATNLTLTSGAANAANITVGTGATAGGLNSANASGDITFWSGSTFANRATAPFNVTAGGIVTASNFQSSTNATNVKMNGDSLVFSSGGSAKVWMGTDVGGYPGIKLYQALLTSSWGDAGGGIVQITNSGADGYGVIANATGPSSALGIWATATGTGQNTAIYAGASGGSSNLAADFYSGNVNMAGMLAKYNTTVTSGTGIPYLIADVSSDNQGASISATNISNTTTAGNYRISVYLETYSFNLGANTVYATITYKDIEGNSTTLTTSTITLATNAKTQATFFIPHGGTSSIQYSTMFTTNAGSLDKYSIRLMAERMK